MDVYGRAIRSAKKKGRIDNKPSKEEILKVELEEAEKILRRSIDEEYRQKPIKFSDYIDNKKSLRTLRWKTLGLNLNVADKVFHPSRNISELREVQRERDKIIRENKKRIEASPRFQLAQDYMKFLENSETKIFVLEQLWKLPDSMFIPQEIRNSRKEFLKDLSAIRVGQRKLRKIGISCDETEQPELLKNKFERNFWGIIYSNYIYENAKKYIERDEEVDRYTINNEMNKLKWSKLMEDGGFDTVMREILEIRNAVQDKLEEKGINTGLDTGLEIVLKKIKGKVQKIFNRIFNNKKTKSLPTDSGLPTAGENTRTEKRPRLPERLPEVKRVNVRPERVFNKPAMGQQPQERKVENRGTGPEHNK